MTRGTSVKEDQAEAEARTRWKTDQDLRSEFHRNLDACVAFHKAMARGVVKISSGARTLRTEKPRAGSDKATDRGGARMHSTSRSRASALDADEVYDQAIDRFERDRSIRSEFTSAEAYAGYERAMAAGKIKIYGSGQGVVRVRRSMESAPAPAAPDPPPQEPANDRAAHYQRWQTDAGLRSSYGDLRGLFLNHVEGRINADQVAATLAREEGRPHNLGALLKSGGARG